MVIALPSTQYRALADLLSPNNIGKLCSLECLRTTRMPFFCQKGFVENSYKCGLLFLYMCEEVWLGY